MLSHIKLSVLAICAVCMVAHGKPQQAPPTMSREDVAKLYSKRSTTSCGCSHNCTCGDNCQCQGNDRCSPACNCNPVQVKSIAKSKPDQCPPCHGDKDGEWTYDATRKGGTWWRYVTTTNSTPTPIVSSPINYVQPISYAPSYVPTYSTPSYGFGGYGGYSSGGFSRGFSGSSCGPGGCR